ncbi:MAG TPA: cytochrome C oxidase subunit IV family protein [Steroidobacteraceae bacterium]|nr:cytochrome C oxidase subunit IV family protein [Steroidobacteraceae bacterium]
MSVSRYLMVLAALLALLALTAGLALLKLGPFNTILALSISCIKTALVMSIFMHATEGRRLTIMVSLLGFIWLAILIGFALTDYGTRASLPAPW